MTWNNDSAADEKLDTDVAIVVADVAAAVVDAALALKMFFNFYFSRSSTLAFVEEPLFERDEQHHQQQHRK